MSGQSFEHRKAWVADRAIELAGIFAVGLYAYAVMSNHVHLVVYLDPLAVDRWSAGEVAERWLRLFPVRDNGEVDIDACHLRTQVIAMDAERVACYRNRLSSLSWFMRCLSEPIARRANREDGCTGRFWEGRYKCQALLDDAAVLTCMTYVDLNPVRAGMAEDLTTSNHTTIQRRLGAATEASDTSTLSPIASSVPNPTLPISAAEYIELVDWTGRIAHPGKRGKIIAQTPTALRRLALPERDWQFQVLGIESRYWRAVGTVDALLSKAIDMGQCWLKGCGALRRRDAAS